MAKQSVRTMTFNHSPDVLYQVITSPEFQEANFVAQGHPAATVTEKESSDTRLVLYADVTEYAKGLTGIDKRKTEKSSTTYQWDVKNKSCTWTYQSPHAQVRVWGAIRIEGSGDTARLTEEFNVEVKIPLAGGKIEKMVMKEAEKYWPRYEQLVEDHCRKLG